MNILYILYSTALDRFYIGSTNNLERRFQEHLRGHSPFTRKAKDWKIQFTYECVSLLKARRLERRLKRLKDRKITETICREGELPMLYVNTASDSLSSPQLTNSS